MILKEYKCSLWTLLLTLFIKAKQKCQTVTERVNSFHCSNAFGHMIHTIYYRETNGTQSMCLQSLY